MLVHDWDCQVSENNTLLQEGCLKTRVSIRFGHMSLCPWIGSPRLGKGGYELWVNECERGWYCLEWIRALGEGERIEKSSFEREELCLVCGSFKSPSKIIWGLWFSLESEVWHGLLFTFSLLDLGFLSALTLCRDSNCLPIFLLQIILSLALNTSISHMLNATQNSFLNHQTSEKSVGTYWNSKSNTVYTI